MKWLFSLIFLLFTAAAQAQDLIHHEIHATLTPASNHLEVVDRLTLPADLLPDKAGKFHFLLHEGLTLYGVTAGVVIEKIPEDNTPPMPGKRVRTAQYTMTLPIGLRSVVLSYQGIIHHPLSYEGGPTSSNEADTPGLISPEGVFLSGESVWLPYFGDHLLTFSLNILLPQGFGAVSQGERTDDHLQGEMRSIRWESPEPQEEVYIVGSEWTEYQRQTGRVLAMAFLKTPDSALAEKYLKATEQYLEMYQKLLGPYPYKKFALVENFWETGYGMPSFTLLGSKVLRLPFVLHSAYPHEILHNWWGNGVYVNQAQGNWSEGLTTYLADVLFAEQQGLGQESRLSALQKYANTVSLEKDFPLAEFKSRYDAASQAIGYSKTLFLFHMLRQSLGDDVFIEALRTFFHENRFKPASYDDLLQAFSRAAKRDLGPEFMPWITRAGAPVLRAKNVQAEKTEEGYRLTATLEQRQAGPAYALSIPLAVTLQGKQEAFQTLIKMTDKETEVSLVVPGRPILLKVDPEYDLFRRLSPAEIPPALSKAFEATSTLILLPSTASVPLRREYNQLARAMKQDRPEQIHLGWDNEYTTLPEDQSVWLFGWENRFQGLILKQLQDFGVSTNSAMTRIGDIQIPRRSASLVLTAKHPNNENLSLSWLASDQATAIPTLGRKLPHYGSFGYLGFQGDEVKNIEKGTWPALDSPMSIRIKQADGLWIKEEPATLSVRKALTTTPPLFSEERMRQDIAHLSDARLKGRAFGTPELDHAAEFIATAFGGAGLVPANDSERSFLQQWKEEDGRIGSGITLKNVVGILPGADPLLRNEQIVIGAHYDHLGLGQPTVNEGEERQLHPGANSNASGVALLLELARLLKEDKPLKRSILFAAFTRKEIGLHGSEHLITDLNSRPERQTTKEKNPITRAMINLDTVGRLQDNRLFVLGSESSRDWPHLLRKIGAEMGVQIVSLPGPGSSDHLSFIHAGVPAIQFFTGHHPDNDRPTDTLEKIDLPGMVAVGRVVKEVIKDLANHPDSFSRLPLQEDTPSLIWERRNP